MNNYNPYINPHLFSGVENTPSQKTQNVPGNIYSGVGGYRQDDTNARMAGRMVSRTDTYNQENPQAVYGDGSKARGGFGSDYGQAAIAGVGLAGEAAAYRIDERRGDYNKQFLGEGSSTTMDIGKQVPVYGALTAVPQAMHSYANEQSGELDEYGRPLDKRKYDLHQAGAAFSSPSTAITRLYGDKDVSNKDKFKQTAAVLTGSFGAAGGIGRAQRDAANKRATRGEEEKRIKRDRQNAADLTASRKNQAGDVRAARLSRLYNIPNSYY